MYMYHKAKLLPSNEVSVFSCFNGFFDGTYGFASSSVYLHCSICTLYWSW